jgi:formylglycine-generating enzyme required for sulfatase activity
MGSNPSHLQRETHPVEMVSWIDCQEFCRKLGGPQGKAYRLPKEAEWEYACRAGTTTEYCSGNGLDALLKVGWCMDWTACTNATKPVGQLAPNAWGLQDVHGNVYEWCLDDQRSYRSRYISDHQYPTKKEGTRVLRGGSWSSEPGGCRAACRRSRKPSHVACDIGCRVVLCLA